MKFQIPQSPRLFSFVEQCVDNHKVSCVVEVCELPYTENCVCWTGSLQNDKYGVVLTLLL